MSMVWKAFMWGSKCGMAIITGGQCGVTLRDEDEKGARTLDWLNCAGENAFRAAVPTSRGMSSEGLLLESIPLQSDRTIRDPYSSIPLYTQALFFDRKDCEKSDQGNNTPQGEHWQVLKIEYKTRKINGKNSEKCFRDILALSLSEPDHKGDDTKVILYSQHLYPVVTILTDPYLPAVGRIRARLEMPGHHLKRRPAVETEVITFLEGTLRRQV